MKSSSAIVVLLLSFLLACGFPGSEGRGRLVDPPARSSMWRESRFNTPINYNDNGLNCGGFYRQWSYNEGKCGVCGDPYDGNRDNERGGKYVTDALARTYSQGQTITVRVQITANEGGWFQFYLCPDDSNPRVPVTEACLQRHLLQLSDGKTRYYLNPTTIGDVTVQVKLPPGITCARCVFRWKWNAGNAYGLGADGKACIGCGPQEQFYGCADVAVLQTAPGASGVGGPGAVTTLTTTPNPTTVISSSSAASSSSTSSLSSSSTTPTTTTSTTTTTTASPSSSSTTSPQPPTTTKEIVTESSTKPPPPTTTDQSKQPTQSTSSPPPPSSSSSGQVRCKAINDWLGIPAFDQWCVINCSQLNICLSKNCQCYF